MMDVLKADGVIELDKTFDFKRLTDELETILACDHRAAAAWNTYSQMGLTCRPTTPLMDRFHDACGSLMNAERGEMRARTTDFTERSTEATPYANAVIDEMRGIAAQYGRRVGRVRFMRQMPKTCLSLHRDTDECRFHIPLRTNANVFFVVDDRVCRMRTEGRLHILNTRGYHTIVNADGGIQRIHMLFDTERL